MVATHLDGCGTCRLLVVEAARSLGSGGRGPRPDAEPAVLAAGDLLAERFQITRLIARGGMGEVYEALDQYLHEVVALKTLALTALDDEAALLRFKAEVRLARKVNHPNVCRILEYGVHARPRRGHPSAESIPFLTMALLSGQTLTERLRQGGPLGARATVTVLRQVIDALGAIHGSGVVHRDLKTENVFLVPVPGDERVVVMDFGLARALDGSVVSTWPAVGVLAGTLDTMAPEQIEGRRPGPAADVFAVGVLVFEVLTGRRPFIDVPPLERLQARPPRLSSIAPAVGPAWDGLVARCLEADPDRRWAGAPALAAALAEVERSLPPS
jgi:serine/threonine protein kinase